MRYIKLTMAEHNDTSSKLQRQILKPALAGTVGSLITTQFLASNAGYEKINVMGNAVDKRVFWFLVFGGASFLAEISHEWIFPYIHVSDKMQHTASVATSAGVMSGSAYLGSKLINKNLDSVEPMSKIIGVGLATEVATDYVWSQIVEPIMLN